MMKPFASKIALIISHIFRVLNPRRRNMRDKMDTFRDVWILRGKICCICSDGESFSTVARLLACQ
ncbi:hypothetical protein KCP78_04955 [Salmonella enterica subsp. enterica]|nr:hypothetical protein KCP78_04955 [Salmonella enterica subsp. enterica]